MLRGLLLRRFSYLDILSKQGSVYLVLCVFPIMYGVQILLDFSIGCPMVSFNLMPDPPLERHAFLIMSGEISGAFLASSLIAFFPSHSLLVPMLGLSLFGCGSLLTAVFPSPPLNSVAFYIMQLSSGCCAAFGLFVLHQFFQRSGFLFRTLSKALFLLTLFGSMGGYLLWKFVDNIHNSSLSSHVLFMHLLTIGAILGLFFVYLIRRPLQHLMVTAPRRSLEEAPAPHLPEARHSGALEPAGLQRAVGAPPTEGVPLAPTEAFSVINAGTGNGPVAAGLRDAFRFRPFPTPSQKRRKRFRNRDCPVAEPFLSTRILSPYRERQANSCQPMTCRITKALPH